MSIFQQIEQDRRAQVTAQTFGHLAPKQNVVYKGHCVFAVGEHLECISVTSDFDGLPSSPWYYSALQDFMFAQTLESGVYLFKGTFTQTKEAGKFDGKISKVRLPV